MHSPPRPPRAPSPRLDLPVLAWVLVAALVAGGAALDHARQLRQLLELYPERAESARLAALTVGGALALAALLWPVPARLRRPALAALVGASVLIPTLTSGNVGPLALVVAIVALASWPGRVVAALLLGPADRPVAWAVGSAYGVAILALLAGGLGRVGLLRAWAVWGALVAFAALPLAFPAARRLLRADLAGVAAWFRRPDGPWGARWPAIGLLLGAGWIGLVGALAPEIGSDAIRQRLATAALFARAGRLVAQETLTVSARPGVGELAYAAVLACAPLAAAKLFNFAVGLWCGAGVWALGRRLGGRRAATIALLLLGTAPFVVALAQVAYGDLIATLFAVACALALVAPRRITPGALVAALLALAGGLAVKASFLVVAAGLLAALLAVAWRDWGRRFLPTRRVAVAAIAASLVAGALAALLVWQVGRDLPGAGRVAPRLESAWSAVRAQRDSAEEFGLGRSPGALVRLPLALLRETGRFGEMRGGFAGYAWPLALPLLPLALPGRRRWPLLVGLAVGFLAWALSAQYLRYVAPLAALLAALSGAAVALAARRCRRPAGIALRVAVALLCALWPVGLLNTILAFPGDLPYRVVFGQQGREDYLNEHVVAYTPLRLLDREAGATRALTAFEYPQLYTRVPLYPATYTYGEGDEAALLALLDAGGYSHVVVDRGFLLPGWDGYLATDEAFLRRNATLVGGDRNAYLYRLVPPDRRGRDQEWARGPELLPNGGFERADGTGPQGWAPFGRPTYDRSGAQARAGQAAFRATPQDWYTATVPVRPQTRYLLAHATRAEGARGYARLQVNWLDAADQIVGVSLEVVPTSPLRYAQFSMLATAPPGAARARVYLVAQQGVAWFDDASFRAVDAAAGALPGDGAARDGLAPPPPASPVAWRRRCSAVAAPA